MIKIEVDLRTAATIRQCLFKEQELYTYDPTCCPQRIQDIRDVILNMDKQIDDELNYDTGGK
jgi:hypothetical protein